MVVLYFSFNFDVVVLTYAAILTGSLKIYFFKMLDSATWKRCIKTCAPHTASCKFRFIQPSAKAFYNMCEEGF